MWNWPKIIGELSQKGRPFVVATVVKTVGSTPREIGAKMVILSEREFVGTVGGGQLELLVLAEAIKALGQKRTRLLHYDLCPRTGQCCGGQVEVLLEVVNVNAQLYIFGSGHVGLALARTMSGTSFEVTVIDDRAEWLAQLSPETQRYQGSWQNFVSSGARWNQDESYVVIMTPSHAMDEELVEYFLDKPVAFLGLIGSRPKWARFQQNLKAKGFTDFTKVQCPVGLDLGESKAPQEIAISISAQLLKNYFKKNQSKQLEGVTP